MNLQKATCLPSLYSGFYFMVSDILQSGSKKYVWMCLKML